MENNQPSWLMKLVGISQATTIVALVFVILVSDGVSRTLTEVVKKVMK